MIDIPQNTKDDKQTRMDAFVKFVLDGLMANDSVTIYDFRDGNHGKVAGISESEARTLADKFICRGYHAKAYYITSHGFRSVTIANYTMSGHDARCAYSEVWG